MKIGLLSDTHSFIDDAVFEYFQDCDEIWHAGDIGDPSVLDKLEEFKPTRAVYGNIDNQELRHRLPLDAQFECAGVNVWMTHIGGYPGRYNKRVRELLNATNAPHVFISGHSHILKVMYDKKHHLLHLNPGAYGHHGFHLERTMLRFSIENQQIKGLEVIELGKRGQLPNDSDRS